MTVNSLTELRSCRAGTMFAWISAYEPADLSHALRCVDDPSITRRRGVVGRSLAAAGAMRVIARYQSGVIRYIPEPPLPALDADKVDKHQAFCVWRLTAGGATFAVAPLVVGEARRALIGRSTQAERHQLDGMVAPA